MNEIIRPKKYYDVQGTLLTATFDELNKLGGISSGVSAGMLNLLSGLSASATQINTIVSAGVASASYAGSAGYAVSASTAVQATTAVAAASASFAASSDYSVSAGYAASASYAASAGTLSGVTVTAGQLNNILYGSAIFKYAIGSTLASDSMILSHGLTSSIYCVVNACTGGVIAGGHASGSTIQFYIQANAGMFFTTTSATVDWIVFGS